MMSDATEKPRRLRALLFALSVFLPLAWFSYRAAGEEAGAAASLAWAAFAGLAGYFMALGGQVYKWRRIFFVTLAAAFLVHFKLPPAGFKGAGIMNETPYCHIALAPNFFASLYQQYLAFAGGWKVWGPLSLGFLWLFVTLVLGRAWCSWACFYGGIDEFFSSLRKKPLLDAGARAFRLRDLPMALLVVLLTASVAYMLPVYCLWLCPFKFGEAFWDTAGSARVLQQALFWTAAAALVIAPLVFSRRVFCSYLCPFGAWQSLFGALNPFRMTYRKADCNSCGACHASCPVYALEAVPGEGAKISSYCNLCGKCAEACRPGALRFTSFGSDLALPGGLGARDLLAWCGLVVGGALGAFFVPASIRDIISLIAG